MTYKDWLRTSKVLFLRGVSIDGIACVDHITCNVEGGVVASILNLGHTNMIFHSIDNFWYHKTFRMIKRYSIKFIYVTRNLHGLVIDDLNAIKPTDTIRFVR